MLEDHETMNFKTDCKRYYSQFNEFTTQIPQRYRKFCHTFQQLQNYYVIGNMNQWATVKDFSKIVSNYTGRFIMFFVVTNI
jgi:hypothetical protein